MTKNIDSIIGNIGIPKYLECERLMNIFFSEVNFCIPFCITKELSIINEPLKRSDIPGWKGCCYGNYSRKEFAFSEILLKERERLYKKETITADFRDNVCEYHSRETGCILETHKNPVCIGFVCDSFRAYCQRNFAIDFRNNGYFFELLIKNKLSDREIGQFKETMQRNIDVVKNVADFRWMNS